jgi:hypothetical protein
VRNEVSSPLPGPRTRFGFAGNQRLTATRATGPGKWFADGEARSRVEWIVDFLPSELGATLDQLVDRGAATMKQTLDAPGRNG